MCKKTKKAGSVLEQNSLDTIFVELKSKPLKYSQRREGLLV